LSTPFFKNFLIFLILFPFPNDQFLLSEKRSLIAEWISFFI